MGTTSPMTYDKLPLQSTDPQIGGHFTPPHTMLTVGEIKSQPAREKWGKDIEFLFSCVALSVGLGNIWRFPFIAWENGGGAFVIPYIIVLLLVGRPIYYMEVIIGQFCSRGSIKSYDMAPIMKGVAYGQVFATFAATTYYASVMAVTLKYLVASFSEILPWTYCRPEWGDECVGTSEVVNATSGKERISSAELFFTKTILNEKDNIDDGLGLPNWDMVVSLLVVWIIIGITLIKGIRSSGKASYFLAIFPYIVLVLLFCRAVTLPGSMDGILYFLKPQWDQLLNPKVWYAAITQMFFSLAICFGSLVMYASFNDFRRNVYRDVVVITTIDSCTSILAGCITFGILGNLAYEANAPNVENVVKSGAGLAFISYPEAIAKFDFCPQAFAVLFFLMLLVLGVGSNIGMMSCVITVIKDRFSHLPHWLISMGVATCSFACGLVYTTPGGQSILNLVDFFGCSFIALVLAIAQLIAVGWIYGVNRLCDDIKFMCNVSTGIFFRFCWLILTPVIMIVVLVYTVVNFEPLTYKGQEYPPIVTAGAWLLWTIGVAQLPIWAAYTVYKQPEKGLLKKFKKALQPTKTWGPQDPALFEEYSWNARYNTASSTGTTFGGTIYDHLFG